MPRTWELTKTDCVIGDPGQSIQVVYNASPNGLEHTILAIYAAYSAPPSSGLLTITDGKYVVFAKVIANTEAEIFFPEPVTTGPGKPLVVVLDAGDDDVRGSLSVLHKTEK